MLRPRWLGAALCLAAALMAWPVRAAPARLAMGPIYGPARAPLIRQLRTATCRLGECVPWSQVTTGERPDAFKARVAGVGVAVTGLVKEDQGRAALYLSIFSGPMLRRVTHRLELDRAGALPPAQLAQAAALIEAALAAAAPAAAPRPPPRVGEASPALGPVPQPAAPVAPPAREVQAGSIAQGSTAPPPSLPELEQVPPRRRWLTVELGGFGASRQVRYQGVVATPAPPLAFHAPAFAGASGRLELLPFAPSLESALAGVGLYAACELALGLGTSAEGLAPRPTDLARLSLGGTWVSLPLGAARVVLAPTLSWERWVVRVRPPIDDLPDTDLAGLRVGLEVEATPFRALGFVLGAGYVRWSSTKELIGPAYFPGGSAWALDARAGLKLDLSGALSARLLATWSSTRTTLEPDPAGRYEATGATDDAFALRLALRAGL